MIFILAAVAAFLGSDNAPPPEGPGGRLMRPELREPKTIRLGAGRTVTKMDPNHDYIVEMPTVPKAGSTILIGGRNVVLVGGQMTVPADDKTRRALFIKGATGTVHIEGLLIDNPARTEFDAIVLSAPDAVVQLQNIRVENLRGFGSSWHADVLQPWGGVRSLKVNGLSATTAYQGIQLSSLKGPIGSISLHRVNLRSIDAQTWTADVTGGNGGYLFWADCTLSAPVTLDEVYLTPRPERKITQIAWPNADGNSKCASHFQKGRNSVTFPKLPIRGEMRIGAPPGGDFVPAGSAGMTYKSKTSD